MSKTTAPLLSFGASGQLASTLVYASWKGRPYARRYVVPANPNSSAQQLTRNTFRFLQNLYKYIPGSAAGAWELYAQNSRFTAINGFIKQNLSNLRAEADLALLVPSPAAGGGIVAADMVATPGDDQVTVALTEPILPTGWTITAGHAIAIRDVNPQTSDIYDVVAGSDAATPFSIVLAGLEDATQYLVGGWFEYVRDNGETVYGVALTDVVTTT